MIKIIASSISKRFDERWIFKEVSFSFEQHKSYAIIGHNGSGKSTLLLCVCYFILLSEGKIEWVMNDKMIEENDARHYFSLASPHVELPSELLVKELLLWQARLTKHPSPQTLFEQIIEDAYLENFVNQPLYQLSTGTKARLKLAMIFHSPRPVILLDEFSSFLDDKAKAWAFEHIQKLKKNHLIIMSTNDKEESRLCSQTISLPTLSHQKNRSRNDWVKI